MTNEMLIMIEKERLVREGVLKYTGRMIKGVNLDGEEVEIPEIEPIHTFHGWKKLGYHVKKGQHHEIEFPIWVWKKNKKKESEDGDEEAEKGNCYKRMAFWFRADQVEKDVPQKEETTPKK